MAKTFQSYYGVGEQEIKVHAQTLESDRPGYRGWLHYF